MFDDGDGVLWITETVGIPLTDLAFRFSRSSGPGGQHVNRTETRVELLFDLAHSPRLSEGQRTRALRKLAPYLDKNGIVRLVSQTSRSQLRNRKEVVERFRALMKDALRAPRKRHPTRPSAAARQRRLEEKRRRSELKKQRGAVRSDTE